MIIIFDRKVYISALILTCMANFKPNKTGIIILVLAICLIGAFGYIGAEKYNNAQAIKMDNLVNTAAVYGAQVASAQLYQGSANCQPVVVGAVDTEGNQLQRMLIDVSCLTTTE